MPFKPASSAEQSNLKMAKLFYRVFGQWVHGGLQGVTHLSQKNPDICKYLCSFVAHHAPKDFTWTSLVASKQTQVDVHRDARNQEDSHNFLVSCGNHSGGELWIEDSTVSDKYAVYQKDAAGNTLRGRKIASKHKPVLFAPKNKHCVLPHKGTRLSLTAYTSRGFHKLTADDLGILNDLHFRLPAGPRCFRGQRPSRDEAELQQGHSGVLLLAQFKTR